MARPHLPWIADVLTVDRLVSGMTEGQRSEALRLEAERRGIEYVTLQRLVVAARNAARHVKAEGLTIEDVRAAANAIEALMRLERRDPVAASRLRRQVLLGEISSRDLLALGKADQDVLPIVGGDMIWRDTVVPLCENVFDAFEGVTVGATTLYGRVLKVDVEAELPGGRGAIFLSPRFEHSAFKGQPLGAQLPYLFAATAFYTTVVFGAVERKLEGLRILELQTDSLLDGDRRITVLDLKRVFPHLGKGQPKANRRSRKRN